MNHVLMYIGAALPWAWGVSHLVPTKNVVAGFGDISDDNKNIITMEWVAEGVAFIFIGIVLALVTYIDPFAAVSRAVYGLSIICLLALAVVSFLTGFKVRFLPFRMCPFVLASSAALVFLGLVI